MAHVMAHVTGTTTQIRRLLKLLRDLDGWPAKCTLAGSGRHVNQPATWDGLGPRPPGWKKYPALPCPHPTDAARAAVLYHADLTAAWSRIKDRVQSPERATMQGLIDGASSIVPVWASNVDGAVDPSGIASGWKTWLLLGQSNMCGRGHVAQVTPIVEPRITTWDPRQTAFVQAAEPLPFYEPGKPTGVGPAMSFAEKYLQRNPGASVRLLPLAVGGTTLATWESGGRNWTRTLRWLSAANPESIAGVLWSQGESDSGTVKNATGYGDRLAQLIADLRAEIGNVPVVACTLGDWVASDGASTINSEITGLVGQVSDFRLADSAGLAGQDAWHFTAVSQRELGRRFADAAV